MNISDLFPACKPLPYTEPGTDEWLDQRRGGLGASDASAILGQNPHGDACSVWRSKRGQDDNQPWLEDYAWVGTVLEEYILERLYEEIPAEPIHGDDLPMLQSIDHPHLRASLDGIASDGSAVDEIKTDSWDDVEVVPKKHWIQTQQQMAVTGAEKVHITHCQLPDLRASYRDIHDAIYQRGLGPDDFHRFIVSRCKLTTHVVHREQEWIDRWIERSREWFNTHVVDGKKPPSCEELEGTVDLSSYEWAREAFDHYARIDARWQEEGKGLKEKREDAKDKLKMVLDTLENLDADYPKRVVVGDHKATKIDGKYARYYRLYPGEVKSPGLDDL